MRAQALPAAAGWRWLSDSASLFRRNPALMMVLVATYFLSILILDIFPIIGVPAAYLAMPVLAVGIMNACREIDWGRPVAPVILFSGAHQNVRVLLMLGAIYLLSVIAVLGFSALFDGGDLWRYLLFAKAEDKAALAEGDMLAPMVVMAMLTPVMMAWWYAPVLAAWHGLSAPKALFFSFIACCVNWRPFLFYGLAVIVYGAGLPALVLLLIGMVAPGALPIASALISLPIFMIFVPILFVSFYVSYREVFGVDERV